MNKDGLANIFRSRGIQKGAESAVALFPNVGAAFSSFFVLNGLLHLLGFAEIFLSGENENLVSSVSI